MYTDIIPSWKQHLRKKAFFDDTVPHKLIICGDLFDRGSEAIKLQCFILELMEKDELILIRGNHEDLLLKLLSDWGEHSYYSGQHISNMTVDTVFQLIPTTQTESAHPRP